MGAGVLDFEELAEAYGDGLLGDAEVVDVVSDALRAFEMAERNAQSLAAWRFRLASLPALEALGAPYPDAARSAVERHILDRWLDSRRELARAWIARGFFFRRQAD
jgi:hypothetical protein